MGKLRSFITQQMLTPGFIMRALAVFVIGSLFGVGLFTFVYARGYSYLGNDPTTCINCHVMQDQYDGWKAGPHANVATCNDCHAPHDNIVHKYIVKGENGFWHGLKFTTGWYPENIRIRETNRQVTNDACLYCHAEVTSDMHLTIDDGATLSCVRCHDDVGHQ
ncbi:cytochrome c nitrite reductase small subunit [Bowdeniella nasicola]|uniref:Cytochrome c nitrite reductase small subunit n=1 Tax=Bowdeniella nasicola TaxID=208480 RepID=A0A1H3WXC6_9ACTO|nr:cytochrome c nitrite reductase small subunit [Bowdeniella nasicola]SDZ91795.1 cytochrome c nitrite reductase small subunit [Bowdeniella nasicola]